ncbi:MAG TPA: RNA-binding protein [Stellaceae bacterium]|nr:RNA-binding protein [Stellaceae bacterium]
MTRPPPATASPAEGEEETGPLRRCLVTGERRPKEGLVRFVIGPAGEVVPDVVAVLPGRGLWLTARHDIVSAAVKKRLFSRAARRPVETSPDLAERVGELLAGRCRDLVGLARRAGQAVAGFEKVRDALRAGPAGLVLAAADGGADGRRRVAALAPGVVVISVLTGAELGGAFGRDRVVHAMMRPGALAERLRVEAGRLAGFRGFVPDTPARDGV